MPPRRNPSAPMNAAVATMRLSQEEKDRLQQLCQQRHVTLSWAMYQGALLYLQDAQNWADDQLDKIEGAPTT